ncbi:hypothetical protein C2869_09550 [Saccharobesus litoralis]|uniref:Outer membrane protein beta-barrel domain-containing protein n=1 Tax=Saccharobesus litoralis TaxID=2172099 RepID=A0A2S0VR20_9ALTE|nr:outer membrane beta-barrel protein [Saccharobesus litoralis]AWB66661.1 hypothetical protein C2869_09550 [Saccharobesus litoralis]
MKRLIGFALAASLFSTPALADLKFGVYAGLTYGGDDLGGLRYENGDTATVKAGGLLVFGGSLTNQLDEEVGFRYKANLAYHFDSATATNADITFDRITFDALAGYQFNENWTAFAGFTRHISPEYEEEFNHSGGTTRLDTATGLVLEGAYSIDYHQDVTFRYTSIEYEIGNGYLTIDGSHIGASYYYYF